MIWLNPIELHGWYKLHNRFLSKVGKNSFLFEDFWLSSLQLNCKIQSPFFSKCNRQKVGYWSYCRLNCIAHHVKKRATWTEIHHVITKNQSILIDLEIFHIISKLVDIIILYYNSATGWWSAAWSEKNQVTLTTIL